MLHLDGDDTKGCSSSHVQVLSGTVQRFLDDRGNRSLTGLLGCLDGSAAVARSTSCERSFVMWGGLMGTGPYCCSRLERLDSLFCRPLLTAGAGTGLGEL